MHSRILMLLVVGTIAVIAPAIAFAAAPANDDFASATEIPGAGATITGSNVDATAQTGEPDHAGSTFGAVHSVWYRWTAPESGTATLDTCGSGFNTRVGVYTGASVDALSEVASNENASPSSCGQPLFAALSFSAVAGTTYRIAVDTSGGVPDNAQPPQGAIRLVLDGPGDAPVPTPTATATATATPSASPSPSPVTNPGRPVPPRTVQFRAPVLNPRGTDFTNALTVDAFLRKLSKQGLTYVIDADPFPSGEAETKAQREALRTKGVGGEVIRGRLDVERLDGTGSTALKEGKEYNVVTADSRLDLSVDFFLPEADRKAIAAERAELERQARERAEDEKRGAKSRCAPIAAGETPRQIEQRFPSAADRFVTYADAIAVLSKLGCDVVVADYVRGRPSAPHAYVKEVRSIDVANHTIRIALAQPGSHDFVFAIREDPADFASQATRSQMPIGTDGNLTVSDKQMNRITVQVIERASGRLVAGLPVSFVGRQGDTVTQNTDGDGETTFVSKLTRVGEYRLAATYQEMEGWRTIRAIDRGKAAYRSMSGRKLVMSSKGTFGGASEGELNFVKALPIVPANLGTGAVTAVGSIPVVGQADVITSNAAGRQFTGQHNVVSVPQNSSVLIGAAPGLLTVGGGAQPQVGRRALRAGTDDPLAFLAAILNPLATAIDNGAATIRNALSGANQAAVAAVVNAFGNSRPSGSLISDKGLGVISTGGGNLIGQAGGNLISDKGLGVISVGGGNLIGQAGGNLISDKGLGVISTGGGNVMPVFGGRIISTDGAG